MNLSNEVKKVVILGGQGDGLVAAQVLEDMASVGQKIELLGFLSDSHALCEMIGGYPVLGKTADWRQLPDKVFFHFALLSVGKMKARADLIKSFQIPEARLVSLIHPTVQLAKTSQMGSGVLITAYAVFQPGSKLGNCCSVRSSANIGHDVQIADFVYIGPNTTLAGYASVEEGAFVAPNSMLRDKCVLGAYAVLGAGSAAFKDIPAGSTWLGVPAKRIA